MAWLTSKHFAMTATAGNGIVLSKLKKMPQSGVQAETKGPGVYSPQLRAIKKRQKIPGAID